MLANTTTNEIKNSVGSAVVFNRISTGPRETEFAYSSETPSRPVRLKIKHQEIGTGFTKRRRTLVRFDNTSVSDVDATKTVTTSVQLVGDIPIGGIVSTAAVKDTIAFMMSLLASLGASTTILYDCTGSAAVTLLKGDL